MRNLKSRGSTLMEFTLAVGFFWVPMLLGVFAIGYNLLQQLEIVQFCRDSGHIFATSTADLSSGDFQNVLAQVGSGVGYPSKAQVIFSKIVYVDAATCALGGHTTGCTNQNHWAYEQYKSFGSGPIVPVPGVTPPSTQTTDPNGMYALSATVTDPGLVAAACASCTLLGISPYNATSNTGLPSGQTINLVQTGTVPFNFPHVTSITALNDYAVF